MRRNESTSGSPLVRAGECNMVVKAGDGGGEVYQAAQEILPVGTTLQAKDSLPI